MAERIDLAAAISKRPWHAVAAAFAIGAWLALEQPRAARTAVGRRLTATVGGIAIRIARELATQRALGVAREWIEASQQRL